MLARISSVEPLMEIKKKFKIKLRTGAILPLTVLMAVFLIGLLAMVADVGNFYYQRLRVQTAINAAWKAGFDRLMALKFSSNGQLAPEQVKQIDSHIREILAQNGFDLDQMQALQIEITEDKLFVSCQLQVSYIFGRVLKLDTAIVGADRQAELSFAGIIPLAIHNGLLTVPQIGSFQFQPFVVGSCFEPGHEYILSPGLPLKDLNPEHGATKVMGNGVFTSDSMNIISKEDLEQGFFRSLYRKVDIGDKLSPATVTVSPLDILKKRLTSDPNSEKARKVIIPIIEAEQLENASGSRPITIYDFPDEAGQAALASHSFKITGFAEFAFILPEESELFKNSAITTQLKDSGILPGKFLRYIVKPGI